MASRELQEAVRREDMARLYSAMEVLSPSQRELVEKVYFEERTFASIAREEGVGESAIRDRMKRIYKKLKKNLIRPCGFVFPVT